MPKHPKQARDRSSLLASLSFEFNYAQDTGFVMPEFPYVPQGGTLYDFRNIGFDDYRDGFAKACGKVWGRVIVGVDPAKNGAYQLEGEPIWGDSSFKSVLGQAIDHRYTLPHGSMGGDATFALLSGFTASFFDTPQTSPCSTPVMLSGSWGEAVRWVIILMPKPLLGMMERRNALHLRDWYGTTWHEKGVLDFGTVCLPFPYYTKGVAWKDFSSYTYPTVKCNYELNPDWTMTYFLLSENLGSQVTMSAPVVSGMGTPLLFENEQSYPHGNIYALTTRLLESGKGIGLWDFGLMVDAMTAHDNKQVDTARRQLMMSFSGNALTEEVNLVESSLTSIPVPDGLTELPALPKGYSWIADLTGVVYIVDKQMKGVLLPFQVFNLPQMREDLRKAQGKVDNSDVDADSYEGKTEAVENLRKQIGLVEALFAHQQDILKGNLFNYKMAKDM